MKTNNQCKTQSWIQSNQLPVLTAALLLLGATATQLRAAPGDVDLSFDPGSDVNRFVLAIVVQDDGKVLIGGNFTTLHDAVRQHLARLNVDGSVDDTFAPKVVGTDGSSTAPSVVRSVALQDDGKILVGGDFTSVNGMARRNLARLNRDGSLDQSFCCVPAVDGDVSTIALLDEGQILIQGSFTSVNGEARTNLARLMADGSLDNSFVTPIVGNIYCLALQADGMILIGGQFSSVGGYARNNLARLNADGTLDRSFLEGLQGPDARLSSIAVQTNGQVVIGGYFDSVNGVAHSRIARLNTDGTLDGTFVTSLAGSAPPVVAIQPDGKILVGSSPLQINGVSRSGLGRLNADGTLDESFYPPIADIDVGGVCCILPRIEGQILVGGGFRYTTTNRTVRYFCQLDRAGALDNSFRLGDQTGPDDAVFCLAVQPDGAVLVGGDFTFVSEAARSHIARLRPDGMVDTAFLNGLTGANEPVLAIALQSDGKVLLGGYFTTVNGVARNLIARLNTDGTLDTSFLNGLAGANGQVNAIATQSDGKILIGGGFTSVNGAARRNIARLNGNGSLDGSFMSGQADANSTVQSLAVQSDGKILIGGFFVGQGVGSSGLARLNVNGSLDTSFSVGGNSHVRALVRQSDDKILIGGTFSSVNGFPRANLARLNANGTLDTSFLSGLAGPDGTVSSLAVQPDGRILVNGGFTKIAGVDQKYFARLNVNGTLDSTFVCNIYGGSFYAGTPIIFAMAVQDAGKILIGGAFTLVNQTPRGFVARLMGDYIPVTIQTPPSSQTVEIGSAAQFSVVATGYGALNYQWFFNDTNAVSTVTTNTTWELPNAQPAHSGRYTVVVTDAGGSVTSTPAMLNVIPVVERRPVVSLKLFGETGSTLNAEYTEALSSAPAWWPLAKVSLASPPQFEFDLTAPLPPQRFYRAWQTGTPAVLPSLNLNFVPVLTLTGDVSSNVRVDGINQFGPTDAWFTLDTVTLTNTSQFYFDVSVIGQPARLYRQVPVP